ncbi:MAG TPA: hypothetical protein DEZ08_06460 [Dehalococcoidia bacterium]|nr:hypothetical protein [Dehalococcoidia bacterium]
MSTTIVMPQMGYDMREGTVVKWYKNEGEQVNRGEVIADIQTDKATVEFEAYTAGILGKIYANEGIPVAVGEIIAIITEPGEEIPADLEPNNEQTKEIPVGTEPTESLKQLSPDISEIEPTTENGIQFVDGVRASPLARRLAKENGIDIHMVTGTGPLGRIVEKDVLGHKISGTPNQDIDSNKKSFDGSGESRIEELSPMRQAIGRVTVASKTTAPHFYVTAEIDMSKAVAFRQEVNNSVTDGSRVSINDLIIKASSVALKEFPKFNSFFNNNTLEFHSNMNIGIAIALTGGLMVPGINNCENKTLLEIAKSSTDLITRANENKLTSVEMNETTFSISNLGMFEVDSFSAIIFPPHAAVLAVGTVKDQPVVRDGEITVSKIMKATVSVDHRVADGAEAAEFLISIKNILEQPLSLVI